MASSSCHAPCGLLLHLHQKLQWLFHWGGNQKDTSLLLCHVCWSWRHAGLAKSYSSTNNWNLEPTLPIGFSCVLDSVLGWKWRVCVWTGQLISALRKTHLLNNTVVIFTADHGELAMEHRQFYKMSMFEGSSHVPLLFVGPGLRSGVQANQLVSLVDIYPTILGKKMDLKIV